jgi:hypothetical protein
MSEYVPSKVSRSFRPEGRGFVSYSHGMEFAPPSPLWTIARIAQHRVAEGVELDLSHVTPGYENQVLEEYEERYGYTGVDVYVSSVRAGQIANIGRQILALNEQGSIQPPLQDSEIQIIGHLVTTVDQATAH